ncbi:50S ribosomal protein L29 [Streptococcus pneumoniae]|nr:50S ribosomal protein L29 [Streptococcus pneumoniae]
MSCPFCQIQHVQQELRGLSQEELAKRENELKKELFELRFQAATGQLEQTARLKEVKKQIARIKTVQSEAK